MPTQIKTAAATIVYVEQMGQPGCFIYYGEYRTEADAQFQAALLAGRGVRALVANEYAPGMSLTVSI